MPSLLPLAISLVAWSSTSDGPLVKRLSRCGSVLAQRRKRTFVVHHHEVFGEHHLAHAPEAARDLAREDKVVKDAFGGGATEKKGASQFLAGLNEECGKRSCQRPLRQKVSKQSNDSSPVRLQNWPGRLKRH